MKREVKATGVHARAVLSGAKTKGHGDQIKKRARPSVMAAPGGSRAIVTSDFLILYQLEKVREERCRVNWTRKRSEIRRLEAG